MDGLTAINEMNDLTRAGKEAIKPLSRYGKAQAEAEQNYRTILRQVCLKLRDEGMPVGMIDKVCYGDPKVSDARLKRDIADAMYKTAQENINLIKLQIRTLDNQIGREWGNNG